MKKLVFIISLPRSGSTLLQKMLGTHSKVMTAAEPWLLLPLMEIEKIGLDAYYDGNATQKAVEDFLEVLPNKKQTYLKYISRAASALYDEVLQDGKEVFVEKTPRYYNLVEDLFAHFPEARFIFLFRNPLSVFASVSTSWCKGRYVKRKSLSRDLDIGPDMITRAYRKLIGSPRLMSLNYDMLVNHPEKSMADIMQFLDLEMESEIILNFSNNNLKGRLGDQIGIKNYSGVSEESKSKWKKYVTNKHRKKVLKKYLEKIDDDYFTFLGQERGALIKELDSISCSSVGVLDWCDYLFSNWCKKRFFRQSIKGEMKHRMRRA